MHIDLNGRTVIVTGASKGLGYATFLASDAASYVTGSAISVDGGSCPVI